jgi:serine phosphatase RsbU (regulator of sigma subunit)
VRQRTAVLAYVAAVGAAATGSLAVGSLLWDTSLSPVLMALMGLAVLFDLREIRLPVVGIVTLSFVMVLAGLLICGPWQAMLIASLTGVSAVFFTRDPKKIVFNVASSAVSTFGAGLIYMAMLPAEAALVDKILPAYVFALTDFAIETALLSGVISVASGESLLHIWQDNYRWGWSIYVAGASLGMLVAWLYTTLGFAGLLLGLPPLYLVYFSYDIYTKRARERVSHSAEVAGFRQELMTSAELHEQLRSAQLKVAAEIERARRIQTDLLPGAAPSIAGLDLDCRIAFLGEMGGDYYDFVPYADGRLAVVCGDVMGKGLGAALLMAMARSVLHDAAETGGDPPEVLRQVNDALARDLEGQHLTYFLTLAYALWDPHARRLDFAGGGHTPLLVVSDDGAATQVASQGPMLGIRQGVSYEGETLPVRSGDLLAFYTDGITEARRADGEQFGAERLASVLTHCRHDTLPAILTTVWEAVDTFRSGEPPGDDATLLLARVS